MGTTEIATTREFNAQQLDLIKRTICVGATDDELHLFVMQAQRMGLDPFARQIHAVKRSTWNATTRQNEDRMTIQVGIDGLRLVADRTGRYAPGKEASFTYKDGALVSATAYVLKLVAGTWHECASTAFWNEYAALKRDGTPTQMWATKPHIMLAKCAEAAALRRAFPAELSGVYTDDEMAQADNSAPVIGVPLEAKPAPVQAPAVEIIDAPAPAPVVTWQQTIKDLGVGLNARMREGKIKEQRLLDEANASLAFARDVLKLNQQGEADEIIGHLRELIKAVDAKASVSDAREEVKRLFGKLRDKREFAEATLTDGAKGNIDQALNFAREALNSIDPLTIEEAREMLARLTKDFTN